MSGFLDLMKQFMWCGTLLLIAFGVLLAMPASRLREIVLPFVGWAVAALGIAYVASPLDFVPDFVPVLGQCDDLVALCVAIGSACVAMRKPKQIR